MSGIQAVVYTNGWPSDPLAFDGASAIFLFMDGGGGHPAIKDDRLKLLGELMKKGVGLGCAHYAVEVPKEKGGPEFLDWIGGYYETAYSTNPHWVADIKELPAHPITRGVKPFAVRDEWYFNMRFRPDMQGVTPVLVAKPSDETRQGRSPLHRVDRTAHRRRQRARGGSSCGRGKARRRTGFGFTGAHPQELGQR